MKLKDLLVQELPKRGGWPEGAVECQRFVDESTIDFYDEDGNWPQDCGKVYGPIAHQLVRKQNQPCELEIVTRNQYEAALAAAQQPAWDGEGLPPVGCECEFYKHSFPTWAKGLIKYASDYTVVIEQAGHVGEIIGHPVNFEFRPIRTEAERKREEAINKIQSHCHVDHRAPISAGQAIALYDAIAAGKIPGVKIEG